MGLYTDAKVLVIGEEVRTADMETGENMSSAT